MKKRVVAFLLLAVLLCPLIFTGCGKEASVLTVDGEEQKGGFYGFYVHWQRDYMKELLKNAGYDIGTCMDQYYTKDLTVRDYIVSTAKERYLSFVVISHVFDDLGLKLTDAQTKEIDDAYQDNWIDTYGDAGMKNILSKLGLNEAEFKSLLAVEIKSDAILDRFYGENGETPITEEQKKQYFTENFLRFQYILLAKTDDADNELPEDEIRRKRDAAKDIVAQALGTDGAAVPFEELIPKYSEDYVKITDDMTADEKETAEKSNKKAVTEGLISDMDGIFNEALYAYYEYTLNDDVLAALKKMNVGDIQTVEIDDSIWILKKCDLNADPKYYEDRAEDIYKGLYGDDFASKYTRWLAELNYAFSNDGLKEYAPDNFSDLFSKVYEIESTATA